MGPCPKGAQKLTAGGRAVNLFSWASPARNRPLALPPGSRRPSVKVRHSGRENECGTTTHRNPILSFRLSGVSLLR